jgi:hypothetical protein
VTDPCQNERENYEVAITGAIAGAAAAILAAPETLGASIVVGLLVGYSGGTSVTVAHDQLARCLRDHGLTAQADALDQAGQALQQEAYALAAATNTQVA